MTDKPVRRLQPRSLPPTAQPAKPLVMPAPGKLVNRPPLPVGAVVPLTEFERAALAAQGIDPDSPTPENTADILASLPMGDVATASPETQAHIAAYKAQQTGLPLQPPIPLTTPPVAMPTPTDIGKLSPERQAELQRALQQALAQEQAPQAASPLPESVASAADFAAAAAKLQQQEAPAAAAPADEPAPEPVSRTGATPERPECSHCGWPNRFVDDTVITPEDKLAFVASLWGSPFEKTYELYGGKLRLTFRALWIDELELIYRQAHHDRNTSELRFDADYAEFIERYRLALQLRVVEHNEVIPLPSRMAANPANPDDSWTALVTPDENPTLLPAAHKYLMTDVLTTETLMHVARATLRQFNRLNAKLEAHSQDPDF